jgi:hypothetical protein
MPEEVQIRMMLCPQPEIIFIEIRWPLEHPRSRCVSSQALACRRKQHPMPVSCSLECSKGTVQQLLNV